MDLAYANYLKVNLISFYGRTTKFVGKDMAYLDICKVCNASKHRIGILSGFVRRERVPRRTYCRSAGRSARARAAVLNCTSAWGKISETEVPQAGLRESLSVWSWIWPFKRCIRLCKEAHGWRNGKSYPLLQLAVVRPQPEHCLPPRKVSWLETIWTRAMRVVRGLLKSTW